jgi:hypothetical protein
VSDETEIAVSVPLDSDGFLRRECPTCEREFKWRPTQDDDEHQPDPVPEGGYYCPYCAIQAPPDAWHTKGQVEFFGNAVHRQVVTPGLEKLNRELRRSGGGFLKIDVETDVPDEVDPPTESDDMCRVDFACHPNEPVKVLDDWTRPVHCLLCGRPTSPRR